MQFSIYKYEVMYTGKQPRPLPKQTQWWALNELLPLSKAILGTFWRALWKAQLDFEWWQAECRSCKWQSRTSKPLQKSMLQLHPKYHPLNLTVRRTWKSCKVQQKCLDQHSYNDLGLGENLREWKEGFIVKEMGKFCLRQALGHYLPGARRRC